jgi:hypothetical protein
MLDTTVANNMVLPTFHHYSTIGLFGQFSGFDRDGLTAYFK